MNKIIELDQPPNQPCLTRLDGKRTILSSVPFVFTGLVVLNMDILSMQRSYQSTVLQWTADSWPAAESQHDNTVAQ